MKLSKLKEETMRKCEESINDWEEDEDQKIRDRDAARHEMDRDDLAIGTYGS